MAFDTDEEQIRVSGAPCAISPAIREAADVRMIHRAPDESDGSTVDPEVPVVPPDARERGEMPLVILR